MHTLSSYYARPAGPNVFPQYSDAELRRDLDAPSLDDVQRALIETELARRSEARRARKRKR